MDNITLGKGAHQTHEQGVCVMEAVAWFAGEQHSDAPHCACPVIASFARRLNDYLDDKQRQRLKPLIPALALSRADWPTTLKRAFLASDYAVRVFAPIMLDARGLKKQATALRGLAPIVDAATARTARHAAYDAAAHAAYAAYDAAHAAYDAAHAAHAAYDAAAHAADAADADAAYDADAAAAAHAAHAAYDAAAHAADAAARATRSQRLADSGIECLEKMLSVK